MLAGDRQIVFITGEAGIGKTTFIEMAMEQLSRYGVDVLCGHCTERFGTNEAFLPLIDALTTRCRGADGSVVLEAIRAHAPTWLLQMPGFLEGTDRAAFQSEVFGATRERMLREFCDLVEVLSATRPWVLVIEDLHWSDFATLDVLSRFARGDRKALRACSCHLPPGRHHRTSGSAAASGSGDSRALQRVATRSIVADGSRAPPRAAVSATRSWLWTLSGPMFGRTQGQPLFVASLVDYLVNQQAIVEIDGAWRLESETTISHDVVPNDLINMITHRIDRLSEDERQLLEVASVAGSECAAALVAAGLSRDAMEIEQMLESLGPQGSHPGAVGGVGMAGRHLFGIVRLPSHSLSERAVSAAHSRTPRADPSPHGRAAGTGLCGADRRISRLRWRCISSRAVISRARCVYLGQAAESSAKRLGHEEATNYLSRALGILDRLGATDQYGPRIGLLRQRSWALRSLGDLAGSVRDLNEIIACASAAGQLRHEVNGLLAVEHVLPACRPARVS